jgi:hypothetical protein
VAPPKLEYLQRSSISARTVHLFELAAGRAGG